MNTNKARVFLLEYFNNKPVPKPIFVIVYTQHINLCGGHRVVSLVNRETLSNLKRKLRSDALPANTIDYSWIRNHDSSHTNCVLQLNHKCFHNFLILRSNEAHQSIWSNANDMNLLRSSVPLFVIRMKSSGNDRVGSGM